MKRQLTISKAAIDEVALLRETPLAAGMGAVVRFLGAVRPTEDGRPIKALDYEVFQEMAERQFQLIFDQVEQRWPVSSIRLTHRVGHVLAGEVSLWVEVIAPHRGEAFAACQFLIEEMKRTVPIWKQTVE